jgi:hypothetical protein
MRAATAATTSAAARNVLRQPKVALAHASGDEASSAPSEPEAK